LIDGEGRRDWTSEVKQFMVKEGAGAVSFVVMFWYACWFEGGITVMGW
jgi:hypothetical protein